MNTTKSSFRKLSGNGPGSSRQTFLVTALILGFGIIIWITAQPNPSIRGLERKRAELRARGEALSRKELVSGPPRWELLQPFKNAVASLNQLNSEARLNVMSYNFNSVARPLWRMEQPAWRDEPQSKTDRKSTRLNSSHT